MVPHHVLSIIVKTVNRRCDRRHEDAYMRTCVHAYPTVDGMEYAYPIGEIVCRLPSYSWSGVCVTMNRR